MPISVQCESCFQTYRVGDDKAGKAIKCKDCGNRIQVPSRASRSDDDDESEFAAPRTARPARRPSPKKKRAAGPNMTVVIAGGAAAGIVVIGLVIFLFTRGGSRPPADGAANPAAGVAGTAGPGAAASPASGTAGWKLSADPPAAPVNWPDKLEVAITIPGKESSSLGVEVSYPSTTSPFVAVGFDFYESEGAQMWNLVTGKQTGAIRGKPFRANKRCVSPDGKYLAQELLDPNNPDAFEFWSFETGELVSKIVVDGDPKFSTHLFDFAGPDQFVTYSFGPTGGKYAHRFKIWDIPRGKLARQIDVGNSDVNQYTFGFSPGRRYFASVDYENRIFIIDLQAGGSPVVVALPSKSKHAQNLSAKGLTFSPDGRQIAILLAGAKETRIATVDMQTGKHNPDQDAVFAGDDLAGLHNAASYKGPKLACLPNQAGYLVNGEVWIDGPTRRVVWRLRPRPMRITMRRGYPCRTDFWPRCRGRVPDD